MRLALIVISILAFIGCKPAPELGGRKSVPDRLERYIVMNDLSAFKSLLESHPEYLDRVISDRYAERPIHVASYYGRAEFVEYLVKRGADIDAASGGDANTAVSIATWKNHEALAVKLLELGANPDVKTRAGLSLCEQAKRGQMSDLIKKIPQCP